MQQRLQKCISEAGVASRRAAETMISAGRVTVNGQTAQLGAQADPETDVICIDGQPLPSRAPKRYIMLQLQKRRKLLKIKNVPLLGGKMRIYKVHEMGYFGCFVTERIFSIGGDHRAVYSDDAPTRARLEGDRRGCRPLCSNEPPAWGKPGITGAGRATLPTTRST